MSYQYSNHEYTEMVRLLAKSRDNVARACHEFVRLFPNLPTPSRSLMLEVTQRLRDLGHFQRKLSECCDEIVCEEVVHEEVKVERIYTQIQIPNGRGVPLGYLSNINNALSRFHILDLKMLHRYIYGKSACDRDLLQNIKRFRGYEWDIQSRRHRLKFEETINLADPLLSTICDMLDLESEGGRKEQAIRIVEFLLKPMSNSPHFKCVRTIEGVVKTYNRGITDEDDDSDRETRVVGSDGTKNRSDDTEASYNDASDSDSSREVGDISDIDDREAEAKVIPDKKPAPIVVEPQEDEIIVQSTRDEQISLDSEGGTEDEDRSEEESGEDSDRPADKRARRPPTDNEIRRYLKQILEGVNPEQVTMKTVFRAVFNRFPDYDLAHKTDFIKAVVTSHL